MRKILVSNMISVDGFFAGKDDDLDWQVVGNDFNQYSVELLETVDTVLLGRVTYDLFEGFWPHADEDPQLGVDDRKVAKRLNEVTKIVFDKTPRELSWQNSKQLTSITKETIEDLKQQPGKDIVIFGSGTIVQQLTNMGLIDEYRLFVSPVILGEGKPQFATVTDRPKLELIKTVPLQSGVIGLFYKPIKQ